MPPPEPSPAQGGAQIPNPSLQPRADSDSSFRLLKKKQKQLIDQALQCEDSQIEAALLNTRYYKPVTQRSRLDLIEVCAPSDSPLADTITRRGGKAERFGLHNADLSVQSKFLWARD